MRSLTLEGSWLTRDRQLRPACTRLVAVRNYYSRHPTVQSAPTPAQLLRFALTDTIRIPGNSHRDLNLEDRLYYQFQNRRLPKRSQILHDSLKSPAENFKYPKARDHGLTAFHADIENFVNSQKAGTQLMASISLVQNALDRSHTQVELEDLLATINALLARLQKLEVGNTRELLLLGMTCAARCFSVPPLQHHLTQYSYGGHRPFDQAFAIRLIQALTSALRLRIWEDPTVDKGPMLKIIGGGKGNQPSDADSVHSHLDLSNLGENALVGYYVELLGTLGGVDRLNDIWSNVLAELRINPTPVLARTAISCIEAFIDSRNPENAVQAARNASEYMNLNEHGSTLLWKKLLEHDSQGFLCNIVSSNTTVSMLAGDLLPFEINLGATWTGGEDGFHLNSRTMKPFTDSRGDPSGIYDASCDLGNDIPGTDLATRILEIIKTNNYCSPRVKLSILADTLNEHEGIKIPLGTGEVGRFEYAWFPQCAPLEFVGNYPPAGCDMTQAPYAASLGLVRVRADCNGAPSKSREALYLMQLGHVGVRRRASAGNGSQTAEPGKWTATGHIIAWNRRNGQLMTLWVGKGHGAINPGLIRPNPPTELPNSFGSVESQEPSGIKMSAAGTEFPLTHTQHFWIDVDPARDLL